MSNIQNIAITKIVDSPYQIRQISGTPELDESLQELANNIAQCGLINPITVRVSATGEYEIVAGHRRCHAAKLAGLKEIPAIVDENLSDEQAEAILVSENLFRQDLTAIEEGQSVAQLLKTRDVKAVAKLCNKSERWVYRRSSITKLIPEWQRIAKLFSLSASFCESLCKYNPTVQFSLFLEIAEDSFCSEDVEEIKNRNFKKISDEYLIEVNEETCLFNSATSFDDNFEMLLRRVTGDLDSAPWKKYCPQWCVNCESRTDWNREFLDPEDPPLCENLNCYTKKLDTFVKEAKTILKNEYGKCETFSGNLYMISYRDEMPDDDDSYIPTICTDKYNKGKIVFVKKQEKLKPTKKKPVSKESCAFIDAVLLEVQSIPASAIDPAQWLNLIIVFGYQHYYLATSDFPSYSASQRIKNYPSVINSYEDAFSYIWKTIQKIIAEDLRYSPKDSEITNQKIIAEGLIKILSLSPNRIKITVEQILKGK